MTFALAKIGPASDFYAPSPAEHKRALARPMLGCKMTMDALVITPAGRLRSERDTAAIANELVKRWNMYDELINWANLLDKALLYEIDRDTDDEGKRMKTLTLNLVRETLSRST